VEILQKAERIDWKAEIANRTPQDAQRWQMQEYRRAVEDKEYWFKNYVWAIDTRKTPSIIPFTLWLSDQVIKAT